MRSVKREAYLFKSLFEEFSYKYHKVPGKNPLHHHLEPDIIKFPFLSIVRGNESGIVSISLDSNKLCISACFKALSITADMGVSGFVNAHTIIKTKNKPIR
jgi:hypothetical protein